MRIAVFSLVVSAVALCSAILVPIVVCRTLNQRVGQELRPETPANLETTGSDLFEFRGAGNSSFSVRVLEQTDQILLTVRDRDGVVRVRLTEEGVSFFNRHGVPTTSIGQGLIYLTSPSSTNADGPIQRSVVLKATRKGRAQLVLRVPDSGYVDLTADPKLGLRLDLSSFQGHSSVNCLVPFVGDATVVVTDQHGNQAWSAAGG